MRVPRGRRTAVVTTIHHRRAWSLCDAKEETEHVRLTDLTNLDLRLALYDLASTLCVPRMSSTGCELDFDGWDRSRRASGL